LARSRPSIKIRLALRYSLGSPVGDTCDPGGGVGGMAEVGEVSEMGEVGEISGASWRRSQRHHLTVSMGLAHLNKQKV
jgi:hypothetical protein